LAGSKEGKWQEGKQFFFEKKEPKKLFSILPPACPHSRHFGPSAD
jgi:hypothetical protein